MNEKNLNIIINGQVQKIALKADMNLSDVGDVKAKQVLSIFDANKDGKIDNSEIDAIMDFSSGKFSVVPDDTIIHYYETDENKNVNYAASWYKDENGKIVVTTRDDDGDGNVDRAYVRADKEETLMVECNFDNNKPVDEKHFINKEGNTVIVMRDKDDKHWAVETEEGVNEYLSTGVMLGTVSNDGKLHLDLNLDGKTDSEDFLDSDGELDDEN